MTQFGTCSWACRCHKCYAMNHIKMLPLDGKENQPRRINYVEQYNRYAEFAKEHGVCGIFRSGDSGSVLEEVKQADRLRYFPSPRKRPASALEGPADSCGRDVLDRTVPTAFTKRETQSTEVTSQMKCLGRPGGQKSAALLVCFGKERVKKMAIQPDDIPTLDDSAYESVLSTDWHPFYDATRRWPAIPPVLGLSESTGWSLPPSTCHFWGVLEALRRRMDGV